MWNFSSLRIKTWPQPSRTLLCLLILLQITAWYPLWQSYQSNAQQEQKQQASYLGKEAIRQRQNKQLESNSFVAQFDSDTLTTRVVSREKGEVMQWGISGKMLLSQWQVVQEHIQEQMDLGLESASWSLTLDGHWQGDLLFNVLMPAASRPQQDWLPVRLYAISNALEQWHLLSVLVFQGEASALLSYQSAKRWVMQGDWLPRLGVSVGQILPAGVTLVAPSGDTLLLQVRDVNGMKE